IHFGDIGAAETTRGFLGQISPLGDMVPVMAGVTMSFKMRGEDRVGLVYVGDGATSTGAFHEGINFAAVQRLPLVVIIENNGYAYSTPTEKQTAAKQFVDKAIGYGVYGEQVDGNDVLAVYDCTKRAVDRARAGGGVSLLEFMTFRRKGHAEHDNQSYVRPGEVEAWAADNDPIDRFVRVLLEREKVPQATLDAIDARIHAEVDAATDVAEASPLPQPLDALVGVYADPPAEKPLWYREGADVSSLGKERAEGWGTYDASKGGAR
ncbi:MAG: thiamine pyrophosphate-dependent dehydrogenase E1 component subunit alpha, partial [Gemmatimonadaceae bacterium]|nr:thiamine pyrophosphate-dependent dehydrogenase E1 component subunit alpha [Gemmatimonadaceae bacterium]